MASTSSAHRTLSKRFIRSLRLFALIASLFLSACATIKPQPQNSFSFDPEVKRQPINPAKVELKLSTRAQRLYVVEGNDVLLATPVSVGKPSSPTPHGRYTIYSKQATRRRASSPGAGYPMPYWMEFKPAYGLHWGFIKPYPSTMGCVRMPLKSAKKTFELIRNGTPIHIAASQPWDNTIGASLPVLDDSRLPNPPISYLLSNQVFADAKQGKMWNF